MLPPRVVVARRRGLEGHLSRILYESALGRAGPYARYEVPDEPGGNTPQITKTGGQEPCPTRRALQLKKVRGRARRDSDPYAR
jgi:hypothetical protein